MNFAEFKSSGSQPPGQSRAPIQQQQQLGVVGGGTQQRRQQRPEVVNNRPPTQQQGGKAPTPNIFSKNILIYSNFCPHSKLFINTLDKYPDISSMISRLCIDPPPGANKRPIIFYEIQRMLQYKIEDVPTIILENAEAIFSGRKSFKWLQLIAMPDSKNISGFNEAEMSKLSDQYTNFKDMQNFGSTKLHDASEQNYAFLGNNIKIETPQDNNEIHNDDQQNDYIYKQKTAERNHLDDKLYNRDQNRGDIDFRKDRLNSNNIINDNEYNNYKQMREQGNNQSVKPVDINFENPHFGYSGEVAESNGFDSTGFDSVDINLPKKTPKASEMDTRYQKLMQDRDVDINAPQIPKHKIDFSTGEIIPQ
jgi:hypothetical protein